MNHSTPSSSASPERPSSPRKAYDPSTAPTWIREGSKNSQQANTWGAHILIPTPFVCTERGCSGKGFKTKERLREHVKSVHNPTEFVCDVKNCSQAFKTEMLLQEHVKKAHVERKHACPYEADGCKKRFPYRQNVASHVRAFHKGEEGRGSRCLRCDVRSAGMLDHALGASSFCFAKAYAQSVAFRVVVDEIWRIRPEAALTF
ncbi:hypothetical protein DFP72DRAFT_1063931 [Ephemerocybe angulata]|uniref:C2H2-type domain-containing protein n=1 Tax=Ephemerocybe angulata TaxID=980116 RepID=A0A8H6I8P9_9AGAR|nr:hypothetical protein DFP72DRAFT_1063931 [Tulosesus angulatus]